MSLYIYVEGQQKDVERFYNDVIYPNLGRLREDDRFRVTENKQKYYVRNKTKNTVERKLRGYSPTLRYRNRPGLWEKYVVKDVESKRVGEDLDRVTDVQIKVHLRSDDPSEIRLFIVEIMDRRREVFTVEKDTGIYRNRRGYGSRIFGGHFNVQ